MLAWNFQFPSEVERWLWRVFSLITTVLPLLVALSVASLCLGLFYVSELFSSGSLLDRVISFFLLLIFLLGGLVYVAARLLLLVESFRSVYFLPPDVFVATRVGNIPHVG